MHYPLGLSLTLNDYLLHEAPRLDSPDHTGGKRAKASPQPTSSWYAHRHHAQVLQEVADSLMLRMLHACRRGTKWRTGLHLLAVVDGNSCYLSSHSLLSAFYSRSDEFFSSRSHWLEAASSLRLVRWRLWRVGRLGCKSPS